MTEWRCLRSDGQLVRSVNSVIAEMDSVAYWYKKEIYFWRTSGSLFWSVVCLLPLTTVYLFICHLSLLHPWQSISGFVSDVASIFFPLVYLVLTVVLLGVAYSVSYSVTPRVPETRLQNYFYLFRWSCLPHCFACIVGGGCVAWCCTLFIGQRFYGLTTQQVTSERETLVLNEAHLFLVMSGAVTGLLYYVSFHMQQQNYLAFPILQREKYFRVRSEMVEHTWKCIWLACTAVRSFLIFYFLFGGRIRVWIAEALNVDDVPANQRLDSFPGLLDFPVLWQAFLCSLFTCYSWTLTTVLYCIYHTQCLKLPVLPGFNSPSKYCLNEALICKDALLQHLAFLDLSHLSSSSMARRQEVFSLSQPGGHPHTWRAIASACLQQVDVLVTKVQSANAAKLATVPLQQHPEKIFHTTVSDDELLKDTLKIPLQKPSLLSRVRAILMTKPVLSYFLMELPDAKSRQLFAACQIPIWAMEALSHLAAASYREDKYGVVQQSLPAIITSLVTLHDNVEKYFKLQPPALRRYGRETPVAPRLLLSQQLRETLKTSIYRLTDTFSSHLGDLQLSADCLKRVRPFLEYKE